ncbi:MmcQ/YjbR family DNA-binding protein [Pyxidicoccus caerfyrddinensis]|uniref:MmcQ/YjbR family DNA-binding protein n=1 Tax=Pyxidicoccus caerfyrddinensis TaxID=2709663 RepID=UPI0013DC030E|nr:MmcQ/YjbR family DNA-binding protein [Pyxidicoccus caerfyrddinensis]
MTALPAPNADPKLKAAEDRLREVMLALPEATEDFPWGHRSGKVKGKMFAILVLEDSGLTVTTKLPDSNQAALMLPFTAPTGYGMGKSGWVTATFKSGDAVPVELLSQWIHESFRAVAPQKVLKAMAAAPAKGAVVKASAPAPKKAAAKKAVAKAGAVKKAAVAKAGAVKKAAVAKAGAVKKAAKKAVAKAAAKKTASGKSPTARRGAAASKR